MTYKGPQGPIDDQKQEDQAPEIAQKQQPPPAKAGKTRSRPCRVVPPRTEPSNLQVPCGSLEHRDQLTQDRRLPRAHRVRNQMGGMPLKMRSQNNLCAYLGGMMHRRCSKRTGKHFLPHLEDKRVDQKVIQDQTTNIDIMGEALTAPRSRRPRE